MMVILGYVAVIVFAAGLVYRGLKIKSMPVHLRWELAPVPHEKGKASYGGSFLEEFEWWTKPREKSLINEGWYMFQEIVFLKGVWEHNRSMWAFSFPFHFGMYLIAGMVGCLVLANLGVPHVRLLGEGLGSAGCALGMIGVLGLLAKRAFDPKLKPFTSLSSYFNLVFLGVVFASGLLAFARGLYGTGMSAYIDSLLAADTSLILPGVVTFHVAAGLAFLVYLPFTYMMHFVAKYFTYHEVRWNDEPISGNSSMQEEVKGLLGQAMTWSAPHIGADGKKTWVDIATSDVPKGEA